MSSLVLGIDLGTSGVRIAVLDHEGNLRHTQATDYNTGLCQPQDWCHACTALIRAIPEKLRGQLRAIAVDGTSGTLLACNHAGDPLGPALPYSAAYPEHDAELKMMAPAQSPASSSSGSLARAIQLLKTHPSAAMLRHQADWINGWLLKNWHWGEEGNNLRLGWELETERWIPALEEAPWRARLPVVKRSGEVLGGLPPERSEHLGLAPGVLVIAGTTDSNAAVMASAPEPEDGITVLGTTLVMKRFTPTPIHGIGVSRHRLGGQWLCGGASNAGAGILRRFFTDAELVELSRQINPEHDSGLELLPLPAPGERFPVDDPTLQPVLGPRPVSDALYLQALLEGLASIEARGWERLHQLGAAKPKRVISLGGGARNPQWRRIRERKLGCTVVSCLQPPAAGVARLALQGLAKAQSND